MREDMITNNEALEGNSISILENDELINIAEMADRRVKAMNTIKLAALKSTNCNDWINEDGKPYLQESGSSKIGRTFGVSHNCGIAPPQKQSFPDGHYEYIVTGEFRLAGASIIAIGSRSSRDPFFTGAKDPKPASEVNEGDVRKAAYSNCLGRGMRTLLGLGNITWDDLETAGIHKADCRGFEYNKSKQEMSKEAKSQREEIIIMLSEMCADDPKKVEACLLKITSFTGKDGKEVKGKSKIEDLSEKAVAVTYGKVKEKYQEWKDKQAGTEAADGDK